MESNNLTDAQQAALAAQSQKQNRSHSTNNEERPKPEEAKQQTMRQTRFDSPTFNEIKQ